MKSVSSKGEELLSINDCDGVMMMWCFIVACRVLVFSLIPHASTTMQNDTVSTAVRSFSELCGGVRLLREEVRVWVTRIWRHNFFPPKIKKRMELARQKKSVGRHCKLEKGVCEGYWMGIKLFGSQDTPHAPLSFFSPHLSGKVGWVLDAC